MWRMAALLATINSSWPRNSPVRSSPASSSSSVVIGSLIADNGACRRRRRSPPRCGSLQLERCRDDRRVAVDPPAAVDLDLVAWVAAREERLRVTTPQMQFQALVGRNFEQLHEEAQPAV